MNNPDLGKLCYKQGMNQLAYKHGGNQLIFKAAPAIGDITIIITSDQPEVGPIKSCGNIHQVVIEPTANFTQGAGNIVVGQCANGVVEITISITTAPATVSISCTTKSQGCAYPNENPSMGFTVSATQKNGGNSLNVRKSVENVASGSFNSNITTDANKKLNGVN